MTEDRTIAESLERIGFSYKHSDFAPIGRRCVYRVNDGQTIGYMRALDAAEFARHGVAIAQAFHFCGHGRGGTIKMTLDEFEAIAGEPHHTEVDDKVKRLWSIETPRGTAEVSDFWWNKPNELSIRGNWRACLWVARWARRKLEVEAACGQRGEELRERIHGIATAA